MISVIRTSALAKHVILADARQVFASGIRFR